MASSRGMVKIPYDIRGTLYGNFSGTAYVEENTKASKKNSGSIGYFIRVFTGISDKYIYLGRNGITTSTTANSVLNQRVQWVLDPYYSGNDTSSSTDVFASVTEYTYTHAISSNGGGTCAASGNVVFYDTMYKSGSDVSATASPSTGYHFVNFTGGTGSETISGSKCTIPKGIRSDVNVYANFAANTYTANFDANGGSSATQAIPCTYDKTYNAPSSAGTRSGYRFIGWASSRSATTATIGPGGSFSDLTTIHQDSVTYYAVWKEEVTISYDGNGGTPGRDSDTVVKGTSVTLPTCTNAEECTFGGWNIGGTTYKAGVSYTVSSTVTANAIQNVKKYTVTLAKSGGTGGTSSVTVAKGQQLPSGKTAPSKTGYAFGGYYKNGTCYYSSSMSPDATWNQSSNGTITAQWNPNTYTLAFDTKGGTAKASIPNCQNGVAVSVGSYAGTKQYYTFSGWSYTDGGSIDVQDCGTATFTGVTQGETKTLYAVWTRKTCVVTFDYNDNSGSTSTLNAQAGGAIGAGNFPTVTREGYDNVGWFTTSETTGGTRYYENNPVLPDATTFTLYARWSEKGYDINFDLGGASRNPIHVSYDSVGTLEPPERTGWIFKGWQLIDSMGNLSNNAVWGVVNQPTSAIPSNKYLTVASPTATVYVRYLTSASSATFTMKALWQRISYSVTVDNASDETLWNVAVYCSSSEPFTNFDGTSEVTVDPSLSTIVPASGSSSVMTFWAGLTYNVVSTYTSASYNNSFNVLKSLDSYKNDTLKYSENFTRTNSGSQAAAVFSASHEMGASEEAVQTWKPGFKNVAISVDAPRSLAPNRVISFGDSDSTGSNVKVTATPATGISFHQWQNVHGTTIEQSASLASPVTFQVVENDVTMTAKYNIVQFDVTAEMDELSAEACPEGAIPTVRVKDIAGSTITKVDYGGSATFEITNISELFQFGGWWEYGASTVRGSTAEYTVDNITDKVTLYAKLKAKVMLGKEVEEEEPNTVSASLVLNGTEYIDTDTCSEWVVIGNTYSIGCNTKNANSVFVCWYDVNTGSKEDPKDYAKYQEGIVMTNNVNLNAYILDRTQEYYVGVYNRNTSGTYSTELGQVTVSATNISTMTSENYKVAASVMTFSVATGTVTAKCVEYRNDTIEGVAYHPKWTGKSVDGQNVVTHSVEFENGTWKYSRSDSQTVKTVSGAIGDETISFDSGQFVVAHSNPLKLGVSATEATGGQYYLVSGTQRLTLSIVKIGNLELHMTRRFNVTSTTMPKYRGTETTVTSLVNQDYVFVVEWGTPIRYRVTASLASSDDISKGIPHVGSDAVLINHGDLYESGEYEEESTATVYANPRNGYRFVGWYDNASFTGNPKSEDAYYHFEMPGNDLTLYAKFARESIALYKWEGSAKNKQMVWKSKVYALSKPCNINSVRIDSTGYYTNDQQGVPQPSLRFKLASFSSPDETSRTADTLASNGICVTSQTMRKLPTRRPERFFQVTVQNDHEVDAVILGTSGEGLAT